MLTFLRDPRIDAAAIAARLPESLRPVTRILADGRISIDALFQREPSEGENQTDIIMLTHEAVERDVNAAIRRIEALPTVLAPVIRIRQEDLH